MRGRRARLVLVVLLLIALTLIAVDARSGNAGVLRSIGSSIFGPIENGLSAAFRPVGSWFSGLAQLSSYKSENDLLRSEVDSLRNRLAQQQSDEQAYHQLLALDNLAHQGKFRIVAAHVTSVSAGGLDLKWTAALDVGSIDGVRRDQTVINAAGLVGRVIQVARTSCTVLLAIDKSFTVGTWVESTGTYGYLDGEDLSPMRLQLFDPQDRIRVGDRLVTPNNDQVFAPQVPVGTVTQVEPGTTATGGRVALVKPFVDFSALGGATVAVIVSHPRSLPRGSLLPPRVHPTATASPSGTATPAASGSATPPAGSTGAPASPSATPPATGTSSP